MNKLTHQILERELHGKTILTEIKMFSKNTHKITTSNKFMTFQYMTYMTFQRIY